MTNSEIRKQIINIRKNIPNRDALSKKACKKIIDYININNSFDSPKVGSFIPFDSEIDTATINNNIDTYLPIVHPFRPHSLWFHKNTNKFYLNKYNIKEPVFTSTEIIAPWELDIVITPLVSFDSEKYRMGMGGGFYDYSFRFKKNQKQPLMIGIAFDEQQNNDIIINNHDIKLDIIITPTRIL